MLQQIKTLEDINGIFNRFIVNTPLTSDPPYWYFGVPDGYDMVEKTDHKLARLKDELASKKQTLQYHEKSVVSLSKEIEDLEKEISAIG